VSGEYSFAPVTKCSLGKLEAVKQLVVKSFLKLGNDRASRVAWLGNENDSRFREIILSLIDQISDVFTSLEVCATVFLDGL
jgi:hypothetical protein